MSTLRRFSLGDLLIYVSLALLTLLCLFPLLNVLSLSVSEAAKANSGLVTFYPQGLDFSAYLKLIEDPRFVQAFFVSVARVVASTSLAFVVTVLAAYPLSKSRVSFPSRGLYVWLFVFVMIFNGGVIPFFITMKNLHLTNTFLGLVLPMVMNVFNLILVMNFFKALPEEIEESASLDGASPWLILFKIYIPLSLPVMATITLFNVVNVWNEYFLGLILVQNQDLIPLQTYVQQVIAKMDPNKIINGMIDNNIMSNKTLSAAKIFVTMLPILIIYPIFQKYFISGIMLGSVKE